MKHNLIYIVFAFFLFSCGNSKENVKSESTSEKEVETPKAVIKKTPATIPHVEINSAKIEDGILFLNVSFSGGCKEQTFELIGSEIIMKSMPPKRTLTLLRDDKGDTCREWVTRELKFNLKPVMLDEDPTKQIIFVIANNQNEVPLINESM